MVAAYEKGITIMTNIRLIAVGAVVAAGAAGTAALTTGTATAGTPTSGSFTVRAHHGSDTNIDLGKSGFSAGDQDLFTGALTRDGKHVGALTGQCTTVHVGRTADQLCTFDLTLGASQIATSGAVRAGQAGPGTFTLPIVGGTGRYRHAGGQITVTASNGATIPITVSLR